MINREILILDKNSFLLLIDDNGLSQKYKTNETFAEYFTIVSNHRRHIFTLCYAHRKINFSFQYLKNILRDKALIPNNVEVICVEYRQYPGLKENIFIYLVELDNSEDKLPKFLFNTAEMSDAHLVRYNELESRYKEYQKKLYKKDIKKISLVNYLTDDIE